MTPKTSETLFPFALFLINVAPLLVGFTMGISSSASAQLNLDPTWTSSFSSFLNIGGLLGCLLAGDLLDRSGRRSSLIIGGLIGAIGWIILLLNKDVTMESPLGTMYLLIFGRTLTGISIGIYNTASLPYVIEITDPTSKYKDTFPCTCQLALNLGTLIAYGLGLGMFWWQSSMVILIIEVLLTLALFRNAIPDSPKWLLENNRRHEAGSAYMALHATHMYIEKSDSDLTTKPTKELIPAIVDTVLPCRMIPSAHARQFRIALMLIAGQQLTGINALMFYTEKICGMATNISPPSCAFAMILVQGIFSVTSLHFIEKYRRNDLLIYLGGVMGACLGLFAIVNMRDEKGELYFGLSYSGSLSLVFIGLYFTAYAISWGPLPMIVCLDMFPACYSGPISAACLAVNWIISFLVTNYFLAMLNFLGFGMTFLFYSISCFFCCWFVARFVPETSSKFNLPISSDKMIV